MCLIFSLGSVSRNTVPRAVFPNTFPGSNDNMISVDHGIQNRPSLFSEIHPCSAMKIDIVIIKTSLIMMRESEIKLEEQSVQKKSMV